MIYQEWNVFDIDTPSYPVKIQFTHIKRIFDISDWCENFESDGLFWMDNPWYKEKTTIYFSDKNDRTMFLLVWGDKI